MKYEVYFQKEGQPFRCLLRAEPLTRIKEARVEFDRLALTYPRAALVRQTKDGTVLVASRGLLGGGN